MKKYLLSMLAIMLLSVSAMAETITVHIPFSATGSYQKIVKMTLNDMSTNKGYQFDIKVTGNAVLSKNAYFSSTEPFLLAWAPEVNLSKSSKEYLLPPTNKNFVGMTHITHKFICGRPGLTEKDFTNKSKSYKIGIGRQESEKKYVERLIAHLGVKHKYVTYKNSRASSDALISGEVNFVLNSNGMALQKKKQATCFLNAGFDTVAGLPTIASKYPKLSSPYFFNTLYLQANNFKQENLKKFVQDFRNSQKSPEVVKFIKGRSAGFANEIGYDNQISLLVEENKKLSK